jgi:hypothetical protein
MISKTVSCVLADLALITGAFFVRNAAVLGVLTAAALTVLLQ